MTFYEWLLNLSEAQFLTYKESCNKDQRYDWYSWHCNLKMYGLTAFHKELAPIFQNTLLQSYAYIISPIKTVKTVLSEQHREDLILMVSQRHAERIEEDMRNGDHSVLNAFIEGEGATPIRQLTDEQLITEAKELGIDL